jgi:5-methylcytosine-specific restriction endonuclease McrA
MGKRIEVTDDQIIEASNNHLTATGAATSLGIKYETYRVHALRLGVFNKNQSGKGLSKPRPDSAKISLEEILEGKHPHYQSNKIRIRLIKEGYKTHKCESCYNTEWLGKPISLELDHIDGNRSNHLYSNLRLLCPNCHAQTDTYRGKNTTK